MDERGSGFGLPRRRLRRLGRACRERSGGARWQVEGEPRRFFRGRGPGEPAALAAGGREGGGGGGGAGAGAGRERPPGFRGRRPAHRRRGVAGPCHRPRLGQRPGGCVGQQEQGQPQAQAGGQRRRCRLPQPRCPGGRRPGSRRPGCRRRGAMPQGGRQLARIAQLEVALTARREPPRHLFDVLELAGAGVAGRAMTAHPAAPGLGEVEPLGELASRSAAAALGG